MTEGAHRLDGPQAIVTRQEAAQHAWAVGQRTDENRAMRDALVARNGDFGFDSGRAFNAKFHVTLNIRFEPRCRARGTNGDGATLSIGTIGAVVQRPGVGHVEALEDANFVA